MYMKDRRNSDKFKVFGSYQTLYFVIAYFSYTKRYPKIRKRHQTENEMIKK